MRRCIRCLGEVSGRILRRIASAVPPVLSPITDPSLDSMLQRFLGLALVSLLVVLSGCSSGGANGEPAVANLACGERDAFCLVGCNLGCGELTCELNDIAQNQPLRFTFSQFVDPSSVSFGSISLRTASGSEPTGRFLVSGQTVEFVPDVVTIAGQSFFGFEAAETYSLTVFGGDGPALAMTSVNGERLDSSFRCTLRVTGGVIDLVEGGPELSIVAPTAVNNVPRSTQIVLESNEVLDETAFFGATQENAPIQVMASAATPSGGGGFICDANSVPVPGTVRFEVDSVAGVTRWIFSPLEPLPSLVCVRVIVTTRVRDLANNAGRPDTFEFFTEVGDPVRTEITETFESSVRLDEAASNATWTTTNGDGGIGRFGRIGGDGRHGRFDFRDGTPDSNSPLNTFIFSTDTQTVGSINRTARETEVVGGEFFFTDFTVPEGITVRFEGSNPAKIHVVNAAVVSGVLDLSGLNAPDGHRGLNTGTTTNGVADPGENGIGQPGGRGGPGGGAGGNGAFAATGDGVLDPMMNNFNGFDGGDVSVPASHLGAASSTGTGGRGALLTPRHGATEMLAFSMTFEMARRFVLDACEGAGGGGYVIPGTEGMVLADQGPGMPRATADGGVRFDPVSFRFEAVPSFEHFVFGGAGGGGGGSHAMYSPAEIVDMNNIQITGPVWQSGGGGGGGGGALGLRVGRLCQIAGSIIARGGSTGDFIEDAGSYFIRFDVPSILAAGNTMDPAGGASPGGGGSGGSVLIQVDGDFGVSADGGISVPGGTGATAGVRDSNGGPNFFFTSTARGGDGSPGYYRVEVPGGNDPQTRAATLAELGKGSNFDPAPAESNVGEFRDLDMSNSVLMQSLFFDTGLAFPPQFVKYDLDILVDGERRRFTDESLATAAQLGSPVRIYFQGASVDTAGEPIESSLTPWVPFVSRVGEAIGEPGLGSADLGRTAYRFQIVLDRSAAPGAVVEIEELTVAFDS